MELLSILMAALVVCVVCAVIVGCWYMHDNLRGRIPTRMYGGREKIDG